MNFDAQVGDALVMKVVGSIVAIILAFLGVWHRFYRTRKNVSGENGERVRFEDAIADAREARKEAHDANKAAMEVQRQMGRLEAENEQCNKRADRQDVEIAALKTQNAEQAIQIQQLTRVLKHRFNPSASDSI